MSKTSGPKKKKSRRPVPLAPPAMRSRKRARIVTTLFHRHTKERDEALARGDKDQARRCEEAIDNIGGRDAYQSASQLSTSHHSTSRWVLSELGGRGWLQGISFAEGRGAAVPSGRPPSDHGSGGGPGKKFSRKRDVRVLEVGAINRELLDAAARTRRVKTAIHTAASSENRCSIAASEQEAEPECERVDAVINGRDDCPGNVYVDQPVYRLNVRAIDLRSSMEGIEEVDFLRLPLVNPDDPSMRYDVIVCSMVINCVTTARDRGQMLTLIYHQLRPGGLCFLTLPRLCLIQSKYVTPKTFEELLTQGLGFEIEKKKDSPKVAFFILRRPDDEDVEKRRRSHSLNPKWQRVSEIKKARKFRNTFAVILDEKEVSGCHF